MYSPRASATARLRATQTPALDCTRSRTNGEPMARTTSALPSVEPSSTTTISTGGSVCASTERSVAPTSSRLLNSGTTTEIAGLFITGLFLRRYPSFATFANKTLADDSLRKTRPLSAQSLRNRILLSGDDCEREFPQLYPPGRHGRDPSPDDGDSGQRPGAGGRTAAPAGRDAGGGTAIFWRSTSSPKTNVSPNCAQPTTYSPTRCSSATRPNANGSKHSTAR